MPQAATERPRVSMIGLALTTLEVVAVTVAAWIASSIVLDGESNWIEGAYLLVLYGILVVAFYFFQVIQPSLQGCG